MSAVTAGWHEEISGLFVARCRGREVAALLPPELKKEVRLKLVRMLADALWRDRHPLPELDPVTVEEHAAFFALTMHRRRGALRFQKIACPVIEEALH